MVAWLDLFVRPLVKQAIKFTGAAVGLGFLSDPLADYVGEVWEGFRKQSSDAPLSIALQRLAENNGEVAQQIDQSIQRVAGEQPAEVRQWMKTYLHQVPAAVRRSLRRPEDPTGQTIPPGLLLRRPQDLQLFLPRMPRFKPGDRPLASTDLELRELLGIGGFGEVWKAIHHDRPSAPPVALKFCTDAMAAANLRKEVDLLDRVKDQGERQSANQDGIVKLIYAHLRADPPCLEYEFIGDGDLARYIAELHRLQAATPDRIARAMHRLAVIVGQAHRQNPPIVHRDLKPDNILLQRHEKGYCFKVMDFGIGGIMANQEIQQWKNTLTTGEALAGTAYTPLYASRQQRKGSKPDTRDDVYALGVILYQMITGDLTSEPPRGGGWKKRLIEQGMPAPLVELLEQCIEDELEDRLTNAQVIADQLAAVLDGAAPVTAVLVQTPVVASLAREHPTHPTGRGAEVRALQQRIEELSVARPKEGGFPAWYKRKFGSFPLVGHVAMWLFYGFLWIPIYYGVWGRGEQARWDQNESIEQELKKLRERLQTRS